METFLAVAAARAADAAVLSVGTRVRIHSLSGRADLNGSHGCIVREQVAGRYGVLVDAFSTLFRGESPGKSVALKPVNLTVTNKELEPYLEDELVIERMYETSAIADILDVLIATRKICFLAEAATRALLYYTASYAQKSCTGVRVPGAPRAIPVLLQCMDLHSTVSSMQMIGATALTNLLGDAEMAALAVREGVLPLLSSALRAHVQAQPAVCTLLRNLCAVPQARAQLDAPIISSVIASITGHQPGRRVDVHLAIGRAIGADACDVVVAHEAASPVVVSGLQGDMDESNRIETGCFALAQMLCTTTFDEDNRGRVALAEASGAADTMATALTWGGDNQRVLFSAVSVLDQLCCGSEDGHVERCKQLLAERNCLPIIVNAVGMQIEPGGQMGDQSPDSLSERACHLIANLCLGPPSPGALRFSTMKHERRIQMLHDAGAIETIVSRLAVVDWSSVPPGHDGPRVHYDGCFALEMLGCMDHPSDGGTVE